MKGTRHSGRRDRWLRPAAAWLAVATLLGAPGDAAADRVRSPSEIEADIRDFNRIIAIQQAEVNRLEKMRDAAISSMVGAGPKYPGAPSGWDDFSICTDVNNDPGSALVHYQHELDIAKEGLAEGDRQLAKLRDEMKRSRTRYPPSTNTGAKPPSTAATATGAAPPAGRPPTAGPPPGTTTPGTSSPPKKDVSCLCRCSCAAAGFNVSNIRSYYSTSPVRHMNPNGAVSESCMNPAEGPCVCQGYVCRRSSMVSSGTCADGCGG